MFGSLIFLIAIKSELDNKELREKSDEICERLKGKMLVPLYEMKDTKF